MSNAKYVSAAKPKSGGAVKVAPYGTTLPTDATTALDAAFKSVGFLSEDGYTNSNSPESTSTNAWSGDTVLSGETTKADTFKFKMLESGNPEVQKVVYEDDNVVLTDAGELSAVYANSIEHTAKAWVIEIIRKNKGIKRTVIPSGTITAISDIEYKPGSPIGYEVTVSCEPDDSIQNAAGVACNHAEYYA